MTYRLTFNDAVDIWLRHWAGEYQHTIAARYDVSQGRVNAAAAATPPSSVMNSRRFTARCLPCFGPRATTARLQVETKSLAARGTITRTSRYLARHDMENAAFASSMPRSSLVLKNSESLVLQTENASHLQRSSLVLKNSETGL